MITTTLLRLAEDSTLPLDEAERCLQRRAAPHALRHTFATQEAANDIPPDIVQRLLGYASLQKSSLYVHWRKRSLQRIARGREPHRLSPADPAILDSGRARTYQWGYVGADDCERYKNFLVQLDALWIGHKAPQTSACCRPFADR
ncbi:tyrosine-type recombinase/integrase [Cupriavidus oxalaticus]|uniref:Tyr recombinase domain-containing protein n=1 Tax=Cupriavidus oxalaticus TaxID=96344 RepID=A0A5P3VSC8_9BURK|nr:tyrosine-type recombinase/integrase [Cupriavidus oxalaticus]QEZ48885.1 hypothetical protein D2917_31975 [Cupriavidus oxalaticus]